MLRGVKAYLLGAKRKDYGVLDVIAVRSSAAGEGEVFHFSSTPFYARLPSDLLKGGSDCEIEGKLVTVRVNGREIDGLDVRLGPAGEVCFIDNESLSEQGAELSGDDASTRSEENANRRDSNSEANGVGEGNGVTTEGAESEHKENGPAAEEKEQEPRKEGSWWLQYGDVPKRKCSISSRPRRRTIEDFSQMHSAPTPLIQMESLPAIPTSTHDDYEHEEPIDMHQPLADGGTHEHSGPRFGGLIHSESTPSFAFHTPYESRVDLAGMDTQQINIPTNHTGTLHMNDEMHIATSLRGAFRTPFQSKSDLRSLDTWSNYHHHHRKFSSGLSVLSSSEREGSTSISGSSNDMHMHISSNSRDRVLLTACGHLVHAGPVAQGDASVWAAIEDNVVPFEVFSMAPASALHDPRLLVLLGNHLWTLQQALPQLIALVVYGKILHPPGVDKAGHHVTSTLNVGGEKLHDAEPGAVLRQLHKSEEIIHKSDHGSNSGVLDKHEENKVNNIDGSIAQSTNEHKNTNGDVNKEECIHTDNVNNNLDVDKLNNTDTDNVDIEATDSIENNAIRRPSETSVSGGWWGGWWLGSKQSSGVSDKLSNSERGNRQKRPLGKSHLGRVKGVKTLRPTSSQLELMGLHIGLNTVEFTVTRNSQSNRGTPPQQLPLLQSTPTPHAHAQNGINMHDANVKSEPSMSASFTYSPQSTHESNHDVHSNTPVSVNNTDGASMHVTVSARVFLWDQSACIVLAHGLMHQHKHTIKEGGTGNTCKKLPGSLPVLQKAHENGYQIVYIEPSCPAPVVVSNSQTSTHVSVVPLECYPCGPVICSPESLFATPGSFEGGADDPMSVFASTALRELQRLFPKDVNALYVGFGSTSSVVKVMAKCNVPESRLFFLNPTPILKGSSTNNTGTHDPTNGTVTISSNRTFRKTWPEMLALCDELFPPRKTDRSASVSSGLVDVNVIEPYTDVNFWRQPLPTLSLDELDMC